VIMLRKYTHPCLGSTTDYEAETRACTCDGNTGSEGFWYDDEDEYDGGGVGPIYGLYRKGLFLLVYDCWSNGYGGGEVREGTLG
jgi:hypothetical protein